MKALTKGYRFFGSVWPSVALLVVLIVVIAMGTRMGSRSHARLKCVHKGQISFCTSKEDVVFQTIPLATEINSSGDVMALEAEHIGDVIADCVLRHEKEQIPLFAFVRDSKQEEYVVLISQEGEVSVSSLRSLLKNSLVSFDGGRKGYGVEVTTPSGSSPKSLYFKVFPS